MLRILIAITILLIYGSLYPWRFHEGLTPGGPVNALLHSWQFSYNIFILRDIALNIAIYVPFGATAYLWLHRRAQWIRFTMPVFLAALLSTSIELAQFYDAHRFTSLMDVATNIAGAAIGMLLASLVARRGLGHTVQIGDPGALLLGCCWAAAMLFPLIPDLSRTHLAEKVSAFFAAGFGPVALFGLFTMWLTAARLVLGGGASSALFPVLGLVMPARLLITGLNAGWAYWATFCVAWLIWLAFFTRQSHDGVLAGMVIASILLTGLTPFRFSEAPQAFSWIPFRALFSTNWETGFAVFLNKLFLYGSATWLLQHAGVRLRTAAIAMASGLAALEAVQLFLPNHAAEITDPLLALLIAWILHRVSRAVAKSAYDESGSTYQRRAGETTRRSSRI